MGQCRTYFLKKGVRKSDTSRRSCGMIPPCEAQGGIYSVASWPKGQSPPHTEAVDGSFSLSSSH